MNWWSVPKYLCFMWVGGFMAYLGYNGLTWQFYCILVPMSLVGLLAFLEDDRHG